jgi:hypothetical protein
MHGRAGARRGAQSCAVRASFLLCLLPLAVAGCTRGLVEITRGSDGVGYRVEGTNIHVATAPEGLVIRKDGHELRSAGGRLTLDGQDAGTCVAGDRVVFTRDHQVVVQSPER